MGIKDKIGKKMASKGREKMREKLENDRARLERWSSDPEKQDQAAAEVLNLLEQMLGGVDPEAVTDDKEKAGEAVKKLVNMKEDVKEIQVSAYDPERTEDLQEHINYLFNHAKDQIGEMF